MSKIDVGPTIKRRRKELGLTLKQLSGKSGLSVAFISQIERGRASPSLMSLYHISEALGMQLNDVVGATRKYHLYRRADSPDVVEVESPIEYVNLGNNFAEEKINPLLLVLPAGYQSTARKGEARDGEAFIYVVSGETHVRHDGHDFTLGAGDSMHYDLAKVLALSNPNREPCRLLWIGSVALI